MDAALSGLDLDRLAGSLERGFPDAGPVRPLAVIGYGFRSVAVETARGVVFRVGRSDDAAVDYEREWRMRSFLSESLGDDVSAARWYAPPCDDFPHGVLGYPKLLGETPSWGDDPGTAFARDLGAFMARLHGLALDEARAAGVLHVDSYQRLLGARDVVMPALASRLEPKTLERIEAWWDTLATDGRMRTERLAVCHHDLWHDNLLRSPEGRLSGVLDMAHVEIGDPAHDFAAPRYFGEAFLDDLIVVYRESGGSYEMEDAYRVQRFVEGREFGGLAWAVEHDDEQEIDAAVEKILRGPVVGGQ